MKKHRIICYLFVCVFLLIQCNQNPSGRSVINPNGDSELALLMREMFDECKGIGEQIEAGKVKKIQAGLKDLLVAEATQPEKVNTPEFRAFAESYLQTVKHFNENDQMDPETGYTMILNSCIMCHESMCPGPITKIEKLFPE